MAVPVYISELRLFSRRLSRRRGIPLASVEAWNARAAHNHVTVRTHNHTHSSALPVCRGALLGVNSAACVSKHTAYLYCHWRLMLNERDGSCVCACCKITGVLGLELLFSKCISAVSLINLLNSYCIHKCNTFMYRAHFDAVPGPQVPTFN